MHPPTAGTPPPSQSSGSPQGPPPNCTQQLQNLARGAAAYSSSYLTWWCLGGCRATYVVDGDTATDKQMLHTAPFDFDTWLSLDLGAPSIISWVRIWHRSGFLGRTQMSELRVGNASVMAATASDTANLQKNTLVWKQPAALSEDVTVLVFDPPVVGRWVTFQNLVPSPRMDDEHALQVRELEVFGVRVPATPPRLYQVRRKHRNACSRASGGLLCMRPLAPNCGLGPWRDSGKPHSLFDGCMFGEQKRRARARQLSRPHPTTPRLLFRAERLRGLRQPGGPAVARRLRTTTRRLATGHLPQQHRRHVRPVRPGSAPSRCVRVWRGCVAGACYRAAAGGGGTEPLTSQT